MEPAKAHRRNRNRTSHRAYRRRTAALRARSDTCWICGQWINPDLPPLHGMAFTADHVTPVSRGGHNLGELRAAHRSCNSRRGNRTDTPNKKPEGMTAW